VHPQQAGKTSVNAGEGGTVEPTSPTVARRVLALRLKERRHELGISVKTITDQLGFSRNYWSAIENDRSVLAVDKFEALFDLLRFNDTERAELLALRQQGRGRGWWMDFPILDNEDQKDIRQFYGLEAGASHVLTWEGAFITGLLQTEEYARALISSSPSVSMVDIKQFVDIRLRRQERFRSAAPFRLTTVMSEAALHQEIGDAAVLGQQLGHLVDIIEKLGNTVDVRIMPFSASPGSIVGASTLHILDFAGGQLDSMIWTESITAVSIVDDPRISLQVRLSYEQALERSLDREASLEIIEERLKELT
jgi:transcriptional regulator with XRE-family HTH domain